MFGLGRRSRDIVTLFHKSSSPASVRVANILKQVSANAQVAATQDQASSPDPVRDDFELNITEDAPTQDQVRTILEYVGHKQASSIVKGARDVKEALQKFKESKESLQRPITVDWNNGWAIAGDNESEILKKLKAQN